MKSTYRESKVRARNRHLGSAVGLVAVAATVPIVVAANANADQISNAIDAATMPITTAQTAIDAVPTATLSAADMAILNSQDAFLSAQETILGQIETFQSSLTLADPTALSLIDNLYLTPTSYAVQYATSAYIDSLDGSMTDQLSSLWNLVSADFYALNGDLNAYAISGLAELAGLFGVPDLPDIFPIPDMLSL